jgi:hypothetical protein
MKIWNSLNSDLFVKVSGQPVIKLSHGLILALPFPASAWCCARIICFLFYFVECISGVYHIDYRSKTGIRSIAFATRRNFVISTLRFQMRRNWQRYYVEGIPQNELTQLQHPWYLSDSPNMSTQFYGNKHCVPNMVKLVTWHGRSLSW